MRDRGILNELLASQGYELYYHGKWHTGSGTAKEYGCEGFCYPEFGNPYLTKEYREYVGKNERLIIPSVMPWEEWQRILRYVYAQISQVDTAGGMVLDALDELGLADDTLAMWTADHGDPIASHAGHFGKESFLREEVLRIPFAMGWPNVIKRAQKSERLISNMDPPVTLFSAAGTSFDGPVDGRDLLQLFCGGILKEDVSWPDDLMCETHGHHWKEVEGRSLITKDYLCSAYRFREIPSYIRETDDLNNMDELYDLKSDPFQLSNPARERSFRGTIDEMRKRLRRWMERTGDDATFLQI